jgi:hypothetical protein
VLGPKTVSVLGGRETARGRINADRAYHQPALGVRAVDELNPIGYAGPADKIRDLHRTLIHEHAHRAVAISYSMGGFVEVEPNLEGGFYQIHYTGRFTMYGRAPSSRAIRLIGLAGPLATMLLDDDAVDERDAFDELEVDDSFSTADRAMAGRYTITDVRARHRPYRLLNGRRLPHSRLQAMATAWLTSKNWETRV